MTQTPLEALLDSTTDADWLRVLGTLADGIHPVDREATRIWMAFHPIVMSRAARHAADRAAFEATLRHRGALSARGARVHVALVPLRPSLLADDRPRNRDRVAFHGGRGLDRYGCARAAGRPRCCHAVGRFAHAHYRHRARRTADSSTGGARSDADRSRHQSRGRPSARALTRSVLAARARDDKQGLFGFLRGERKQWTVTLDERDPSASFTLINSQAITTAAAEDSRDWRARDPRCTEGPIPVQCRSASCGTCWIGVLGGAHKLSAMEPRERQRLAVFGTCRPPRSDRSSASPVRRRCTVPCRS